MQNLTCIQEYLLWSIIERGGTVQSLLKLTRELHITYRYAHHCLGVLERRGLLTVERSPRPRPLTITATPTQFEHYIYLATSELAETMPELA